MLSLINSLLFDVILTLLVLRDTSTCQACKGHKDALELRCTYDFLTRLRDEFEPLRA
jgi:hypothetical protein